MIARRSAVWAGQSVDMKPPRRAAVRQDNRQGAAAPAKPRPSAAVSDAQHEIDELQRRRSEMLVSASVDGVQEIDTAIGRAAAKADIAEARFNALERALESLQKAERDAQTAVLARAQHLTEEARQLIVGDDAKAASAIVETLARLAKIDAEVRALNARLPPAPPTSGWRRSGAIARRSAERWCCPASLRTMRTFGQRDLDA
jgi:hypothetical protein